MNARVRISLFPAEFESLPSIAQYVDECCASWHVNADAQFAIRLAVEEAATNIIEHAYNGAGDGLEITCRLDGRDVQVELRDWGQPFDPGNVARPDVTAELAERPIGGLGIHFMQQLMDEVRFSFESDGNRVLMIKRNVVT
ncbi:MAG: ATP-binding protein [Caldilineales bacterium]|nr:ATP-binding protein [Caldilineales bacterium]